MSSLVTWVVAAPSNAHFFVILQDRVSATPVHDGSGWLAEVFLNLPDVPATQIITAESYIAGLDPDFTFRTEFIDFPAGSEVLGNCSLDTDFATIGDFLGSGISDVSDSAKLLEPGGNFVIRFSGLLDVRMNDAKLEPVGIPVLLDFATYGHGGYRTRIGQTSIYRVSDTQFLDTPFFTENALMLALGLFPIEITYLNRNDPANQFENACAGVELGSWHAGGLPWNAGELLTPLGYDPMLLTPPRVIYQPDEIPVQPKGDLMADFDVSLHDFQGFQNCFTGPGSFALNAFCQLADFDADNDVDNSDLRHFRGMLARPNVYAYRKGDFDANLKIDLADFQWVQLCFATESEDEFGGLTNVCSSLDFDFNGSVNLVDYRDFAAVFAVNATDAQP